MPLMPDLLDAEVVRDAVEADLTMHLRALPPDSVRPALVGHQVEVVQWICDRLSGDLNPTPEETVAVNKGRHGVRPVAVWDLPSKIAYWSLARMLLPKLPNLWRGHAEWIEFQEEPLSRDGRYIVATDIAACYQNLDHGLLANELLVQTGEFARVSAIVELLQQVSGRSYGLPQQSYPSDWISEPFLARLERALVRRGLDVTRYNDDFRFVCPDWAGVVQAIEVFDEEARKVGLTVNDQKTVTWSRGKYEEQVNYARGLRKDITGEENPEITSDYAEDEGVEDEQAPPVFEAHVAEEILYRWVKVAGRGRVARRRRAEHRVIVELVPGALRSLARSDNSNVDVLKACMKMLRFERTVTPAVGQYLSNFGDDDQLLGSFDTLLKSRSYLNGWQAWWLQQPIARLNGFASGVGANRRLRWARTVLTSAEHSPVLRAEVARTLARHNMINLEELLSIYDRSSEIVRPVLAIAVALLKPGANVRRAIVDDSKINKWAYDWASKWS